MKLKLLVSIFTLLAGFQVFSQTGTLTGKVTNASSGEIIPNVKISIEGQTYRAITDFDGKFIFEGVNPGTYALNFNGGGFNVKIVTDVIVRSNETTELIVTLDAVIKEIGQITVRISQNKETNENLIKLQRNSAGQVDGISAETIKKSNDKDAGAAIRRVSSASIQDNKFVIIRGLNDRYNTAMINGLPLPSTEADRKAFSFDIFPSAMLDNMLIYKTASPDLPGDFAGGVIQINTKDIPEKDFISFSAGSNFNSQSTFKEFYTYQGSKNDWIGLGTNDRALPSNMLGTDDFKASLSDPTTRYEQSKIFENDWKIDRQASSPLGQNYQLGFAKNLKIDSNDFGIVGGATYNNTRRYLDVQRKDFNDDTSRLFDYHDATYRENVSWGAMLNFAYKMGKNNKISLKNMVSNNSTDQVINRTGENIDADQIIKASTMQYTSNKLFTSQLLGEHSLEKSKIKLKWGVNYSKTKSDVPNLKRMLYYKNRTEQGTISDSVYTAYVPFGSPSPDFAGRFFSELHENLYAGMAEISLPYTLFNQKSHIKLGYAGSIKSRNFNARVFGYSVSSASKFNYDLLYMSQDSIFDEANIGQDGFKLGETTNPSDSYTASTNLHAGYLMTDQKLGEKLRAVYGLRVENFNQKLNSMSYGGDSVTIDNTTLSFLPSLNLTYALGKKMNLRGAASRTVARPDFRELAPFSFYDFNTSSAVVGNDTLKPSNITNLDLRFEYFPGNGQVVSTSFFYKDFTNPIENTVFFGGSGSRTYTYRNVENAVDYGMEIEFRSKLSILDSMFNTNILDNFTIYTNLTLVKSVVDLSNVPGAVSEEDKFRPMQGQSPYLINAGLIYQNNEKGFGASILFNQIGRRIAFVGTNGYQDIYENPRSVLDLQVTKRIIKNGELKLSISDIFNQNAIFYQDFNHSKKFEASEDKQITGIKYGRNMSLSFSYSF